MYAYIVCKVSVRLVNYWHWILNKSIFIACFFLIFLRFIYHSVLLENEKKIYYYLCIFMWKYFLKLKKANLWFRISSRRFFFLQEPNILLNLLKGKIHFIMCCSILCFLSFTIYPNQSLNWSDSILCYSILNSNWTFSFRLVSLKHGMNTIIIAG